MLRPFVTSCNRTRSRLHPYVEQVLRSYPEIVTETTEDPCNPFVTSVIMDGVVVARGGFTNKKSSRQVGTLPCRPACRPTLRPSPPPAQRVCTEVRSTH